MKKNLLIITQKVDENDQLLGFFIKWLAEFSKYFDSVQVFCLEKGDHDLPENIEVISLGKDRGVSKLGQLFNFYKLILSRRNRYETVFVHMNPIWVVLGGFWWRFLNKKIFLWYTHGAITFKLKLAEKFVNGVFTASKESFRLPSKKVIVTGHGIDTGLFRPDEGKKIKDGKFRILSVGRFSPVKNYESLVETAHLLAGKKMDFVVTMVGEPVLENDKIYAAKVKKRIANLGLEKYFDFPGKVNNRDLAPFYQAGDLFVHLSRTGSLDKALLEAMACGMKVLSSNDSAKAFLPSESFLDNEEPDLLAKKIMEAASDGQDIAGLRPYVVNNHGLPALVKRISGIVRRNRILVSGYIYVADIALKTFDYYPGADSVYFLVPDTWPIKKGKYVFKPTPKENIRAAKAFFHHSNYPVIGGILKGWIPVFPFVLARQKPDLVFSASEPNLLTTLYQGFFTKLFNVKHVIFTWENVAYESKFKGFRGMIQKIVVKLNLLLCDGLVCGSIRSERMIKSLINRPTTVIPSSGVDTDFFKRDYSKKTFQNSDYRDKIVFVFIGAMDYRKGVHVIIEAFSKLSKTVANAQLIIAGSGLYEKEIDLIIERSGMKNSIIRVPWLDSDQVRELLNCADVFLYPSIPHAGWEEQFGYSLAEASLMELPIITTESGSISEIVINGKTGILIRPNDSDSLKEAMLDLAQDKPKRISMGKAGRRYIYDNFSHEVVASKYFNFFESF